MSKLTQVDFVPRETVSYSKETQTPTEALSHSDQKAGRQRWTHFYRFIFKTLPKLILRNLPLRVSDEEEDEEISAPPPTEDTQEDVDEHGEMQEDGEDKTLQHIKLLNVCLMLFCLFNTHMRCIFN